MVIRRHSRHVNSVKFSCDWILDRQLNNIKRKQKKKKLNFEIYSFVSGDNKKNKIIYLIRLNDKKWSLFSHVSSPRFRTNAQYF